MRYSFREKIVIVIVRGISQYHAESHCVPLEILGNDFVFFANSLCYPYSSSQLKKNITSKAKFEYLSLSLLLFLTLYFNLNVCAPRVHYIPIVGYEASETNFMASDVTVLRLTRLFFIYSIHSFFFYIK